MKMLIESGRLYDTLKYVAIFFLPALATFISVLGPTWDIPYTDQIVTTVVAFNTFLGALVGISSAQFHAQTDKK